MTLLAHPSEPVLQHTSRAEQDAVSNMHAQLAAQQATGETRHQPVMPPLVIADGQDHGAVLQAAARAVEKVAAVAKRVWRPVPKELAVAALAGTAIVFAGYTVHSVWVRRLGPAVMVILGVS